VHLGSWVLGINAVDETFAFVQRTRRLGRKLSSVATVIGDIQDARRYWRDLPEGIVLVPATRPAARKWAARHMPNYPRMAAAGPTNAPCSRHPRAG
jgi:hypothetical protein